MTETAPTKSLPRLAELAESLARAARLEAAKELPENEPGSAEFRTRLDTEYWRLVNEAAEKLVRDELPKDYDIPGDLRLLINFALFAHPRLDAISRRVQAWPRGRQGEFDVVLVTDGLAAAYRDALRLEVLAKLRAKQDAVQREIKDWPEFHLERVKFRDRQVAEALGDTPFGQHVLRLYSEMDEKLEQYKRLERRNQTEGFQTPDERKVWITIKQYMDTRVAAIEQVLGPLAKQAKGAKEQLARLAGEVNDAHAEVRNLEREIRDLEGLIAQQAALGERGERLNTKPRQDADKARAAMARANERIRAADKAQADLKQQHRVALAADRVTAAAEAVGESLTHLMDLHQERRDVASQILDEENTVHQITPTDVKAALLAELGNVRGLLRLGSRYAKVAECAVPVNEGETLLDPPAVLDALSEIEEYDPRLFINPSVKRFGRPQVFLAPGVGDGVYDGERNRLVIPQRTLKGALASVANAVVLYRLDVDAAHNERRLFNSYKEEIKDNQKIRSNLKLRMNLINEYLLWITKESRGNGVLPREVREWFEWQIAPGKADPQVPREFLGLTIRQLKQKLEELERQPLSADREYRQGILLWLLDPENEANLREQVLPRVEKAAKLDATTYRYLYSAATLHKKLRSYSRAIELFSQYARDARQSWWTKKAVELCSQCR
ncbi:MAG: hypothetical protein IT463_05260 [Planctomycetes bacterium]|nr:hypothetical protein [Planctomycetota bacterium]